MTGLWIYVGMQLRKCSEYSRSLPITGFCVCKGCTGCWVWQIKPEYALMSQYAWIYLNNAKYDWTCWHAPEKTEWWICQNAECVWCSTSHKVTVQITHQLARERETYSGHCQKFEIGRFAKIILNECSWATRNFSWQGRVCRTKAFWWTLRQKHKKGPIKETF